MIRRILKIAGIIFLILVVLGVLGGSQEKGGMDETTPEGESREESGGTVVRETGATGAGESASGKPPAPVAEENLPTRSSGAGGPYINIPGWSDSPYVTRDGQELYYMYSRYNFFPVFSGGTPKLEGGDGPAGHRKNDTNPYDDSDIYVSKRNADGSWGKPVSLSFNDTRGGCCAMVVEGPPFTIYYQTFVPGMGQDLVYRVRNANGTWGPETNFGAAVNSPQTEDNPHVAPTQDAVWFTSNRPGGMGGNDLWFSEKVNGVWQQAVNLGPVINTALDEDQIWVSPTGNDVYFNRDGIYKTTWTGAEFTKPVRVNLGYPFAAEVSLPDSGNEIFFGVADQNDQRIRIYSAKKQPNGSWGKAQPVD